MAALGPRIPSLALALALTFAPVLAGAAPQDPAPAEAFTDAEVGVTLGVDALEGFTATAGPSGDGQRRAAWKGSLGPSAVELSFWRFPRGEFRVERPEEVVDFVESHYARRRDAETGGTAPPFRFEEREVVAGPYGWMPYAQLAVHTRHQETKPVQTVVYFAGLAPEWAYGVEAWCEPALNDDRRAELVAFLTEHVRYSGEVQVAEWTDEEVDARWRSDAPDDLVDDLDVIRTKNYLILTNSSGGKLFAKKMEENYEKIRKIYPFEDVEGQRLLPVFLFRMPDEYYAFCVKSLGWSPSAARRSKGVASRDFYATWYEAPNDAVHIHEATHQIFRNRLRLSGGGSWFQEGVAEYVETRDNDRKLFRNAVKDDAHVPLRQFVQIPSLLQSAGTNDVKGGSEAGDNYLQAGCIIEFVHRSKFGKGKFMDFVHAVGSVPRGDVEAIEAALGSVFGCGLDRFEEEFVEYWEKR